MIRGETSADSVFVTGKAALRHRAIENVVRNALKYSPQGTQVQVAVTPLTAESSVCITVDDSGNGVAEKDLEAIFQPFFRATANQDAHGHGLGLAIARQIIAVHGGTIRAVNRTEGGLRIEIRLPLA
jgi:two-component system, OmpR family, sensor kinase